MELDIADVVAHCQIDQGQRVCSVAVDAAVAEQAHQVQTWRSAIAGRALLALLDGRDEGRVLEERAGLDVVVDAWEVLENGVAGADVEMPALGVPELVLWRPDRQS